MINTDSIVKEIEDLYVGKVVMFKSKYSERLIHIKIERVAVVNRIRTIGVSIQKGSGVEVDDDAKVLYGFPEISLISDKGASYELNEIFI